MNGNVLLIAMLLPVLAGLRSVHGQVSSGFGCAFLNPQNREAVFATQVLIRAADQNVGGVFALTRMHSSLPMLRKRCGTRLSKSRVVSGGCRPMASPGEMRGTKPIGGSAGLGACAAGLGLVF